MTVVCAGCGDEFEARSTRAKWCKPGCKKRVQRGGPLAADSPELSPATPVGLVDTVRKELETLGKAESYLGVQALIVAERMASGKETGSAVTSLSQELTRLMAAARVGVKTEEDEVARARRIRDEKRQAAAAGKTAR